LTRGILIVMVLLIGLRGSCSTKSFVFSDGVLDAKSRHPISTASRRHGRQLVLT